MRETLSWTLGAFRCARVFREDAENHTRVLLNRGRAGSSLVLIQLWIRVDVGSQLTFQMFDVSFPSAKGRFQSAERAVPTFEFLDEGDEPSFSLMSADSRHKQRKKVRNEY